MQKIFKLNCIWIFCVFLQAPCFAQDQGILHNFVISQRQAQAEPPIQTAAEITTEGDVTHLHYRMTSQTWPMSYLDIPVCPTPYSLPECLIDNKFDNSWKHVIDIYVPSQVQGTSAFVYLGSDVATTENHTPDFSSLAQKTRMPIIALSDVPYQGGNGEGVFFPPLYLFPLTEDFLVGKSWRYFLDNPSQYQFMPIQMPMVFAAMEAMDFVQGRFQVKPDPHVPNNIQSFIVGGVSKRGWATWLTAMEDERVVAIIPAVFDFLNTKENAVRMKKIFHEYFPAAYLPYWTFHVSPDEVNFDALMGIVDPLSYLTTHPKRFKITKYMVNSSGDDIFLPDNSRNYMDTLIQNGGQNMLRYMVNTGHRFNPDDLINYSLIPFLNRIQNQISMPQLEYSLASADSKTHQVTVKFPNVPGDASNQVKSLIVWQATNKEYRDFRYQCDKELHTAYVSSPQTIPLGSTSFTVDIKEPEVGWNATFVEITYNDNFVVTTPVYIFPDTIPSQEPFSVYPDIFTAENKACSVLPKEMPSEEKIPPVLSKEYADSLK